MKIKICGITQLKDAQMAIEAGADLLGFIFYPKSPRYIEPPAAAAIVQDLITHNVVGATRLVGVFVDEPVGRVREIVAQCRLDLVQLHGSEPPVEVRMLQPYAFKALRPRQRGDAEAMVATFAPLMEMHPDRPAFLVDAYHPWKMGGTGHTADWIAAKVIARRFPILLAGGLTATNVAEAIQLVNPWGVDTSSGVEAEPGKKDPVKVRDFIQAAREAQPHPD